MYLKPVPAKSEFALPRLLKVGVISNPLSQRNKSNGVTAALLKSHTGSIFHEVLDRFDALPDILRDFAHREINHVIVDGGDGTVQATLTELYGRRPFDGTPLLSVLPSGMTNAMAADVGLAKPLSQSVPELMAAAKTRQLPRRVAERNVMQFMRDDFDAPVYGMFFANGAIYRSIQYCRERVHTAGLVSSAAVGVTMSWLMFKSLWAMGSDPHGILRGTPVQVRDENGERSDPLNLFTIATTLDRLNLGIRPYWGEQTGGMRFTEASFPARKMFRSAPSFMFGKKGQGLDPKYYRSYSVDRMQTRFKGPFVLDGEIFPDFDGPLTISAGARARFVR